ncbi:MAG: exo-alpha-sialidase [Candidatus Latescibacteria bacterium]|nr:exo-alpha-sialidase [Candidatus Latescibacterota bacterium]
MVNTDISAPIRIADVIDGHVHPALCRTQDGDLLAVYNIQGGGGKELLLCRSTDGGLTWSRPRAVPHICGCSIYPGSLTTLQDGRILLNWSCYREPGEGMWREPQFALSEDGGETWSKPHSYPIDDHSSSTCMRHPVVELSETAWICPFYDRTVLYDPLGDRMAPFGDGRNHGMVPIVQTTRGTLISGAPQTEAPVPVGVPGGMVDGLRSSDCGARWQALGVFPHFGVAGYDLTVLANEWVVMTYIVYGVGVDGEFSYELALSRDDGVSWDFANPVEIYNPGRRIGGRGWPRTVPLNGDTLATLFYDLSPDQEGGPGLYLVRTELAALGS